MKRDGHILIKGVDSESAYVKVEGSKEMLYLRLPVTEAKCEIPDASYKILFQHYFKVVLGAQHQYEKHLHIALSWRQASLQMQSRDCQGSRAAGI